MFNSGIMPKLGKRGPNVFRLARVYALASAAGDPKLQEDYRTKAFTTLNEAVEVGLRQTLLLEDDLEPIRSDPRFRETLRLYTEKENTEKEKMR
jgi:hypothetical protein